MPRYTPPLRDQTFVLHELLAVTDAYQAMPAHASLDADTINQVVEASGTFCAEVLFPLNQSGDQEGCHFDPAGCVRGGAPSGAQRGIAEADLQLESHYLSLLAVPAQRSLPSGFPKGVTPLDELRVEPQQVAAGARLFTDMRCAACHTVEMKTGPGHLFAELRNQTIRPYSDLLLHDMGEGLADGYAEGQAKGNLWRTAPLWGIGYTEKVMGDGGKAGYLHDGRARNLTEAILWHDGEARAARQRFANLGKAQREALLAFLRSL